MNLLQTKPINRLKIVKIAKIVTYHKHFELFKAENRMLNRDLDADIRASFHGLHTNVWKYEVRYGAVCYEKYVYRNFLTLYHKHFELFTAENCMLNRDLLRANFHELHTNVWKKPRNMRCGTVRYGTKNMCLTTNILNCLHLSVEKYDSQQCRLFEDADSFIICADDTRKDALLLDRILRHILVLYAWVYLYVELNVSYTLFNNFFA